MLAQPLTKHDIKETVAQSVEATVPPAIQAHVNGHIKRVDAKIDDAKIQLEAVDKKLDGHIDAFNEEKRTNIDFRKDMEPVREAARTLNAMVRFSKWIGIPLLGTGGLLALINHIFS